MNAIKDLKEKLERELMNYAQKEISPNEWDKVFDAIDAYKDLETICAMQGEDEEYAHRGGRRYYPTSAGMPDMYAYDNGNSYRDYSYQNNGGRSYHGNSFQDQLRRLMDSATTDSERAAVQNLLQRY